MERLADKPFALLGINSDEDRDRLRQTVRDEPITWRSWWDGSTTGPIQTLWQIDQRPSLHVLDENGVIRFKDIDPEQLDKAVDSLLAELASRSR